MTTTSAPFWAHQPFFGSSKPKLKLRHADHPPATIEQIRRDSEEAHQLRQNSVGSATSPTITSPITDVFIPRAASPIRDSNVTSTSNTVDNEAAAQKRAEKAERKRQTAIQKRQEHMESAKEELRELKNNAFRDYLHAIQQTSDVVEPAALHLAPFVKVQFEKNNNFQGHLLSSEDAPSQNLYRLANAAIRASNKRRGDDLPVAYHTFFDAVSSVSQYQDFINAGETTLRKTLGL